MTVNREKRYERINRRCEILESLGFEIAHEDSNVEVYHTKFEYITVDFSAIDETKFLSYAIQKVYEQAYKNGRDSLKTDLKELLHIENEGDY